MSLSSQEKKSFFCNVDSRATAITKILLKHSKLCNLTNQKPQTTIKSQVVNQLLDKIKTRIANGEVIRLTLPSFPYKSPNPRRVLGDLPDLAEELSIRSLSQLCSEIDSISPFGCELIIASDGRVYGDLQQEWWPDFNDRTITNYRDALENLVTKHTSLIKIFSLDQLGICNAKAVPSYLEPYSPEISGIKRKIANDSCQNRVYTNMKYFRQEELKSSPEARHLSKNCINRAAASFTVEQIRRGHAWSTIIEKQFPDSIRLSVHQHFNSEKLGICLTNMLHSRCMNANPTPWHSCALIYNSGRSIKFVKYSEGLKAGAKMVYKDGQRYALSIESI